ncbi:MAG TPA: GNAT family N-acetyltransferase [Opitutales bacterium]|nr:GNAT family N-acetyltransferase [Opitutales bacterium]
MIPRLATARLVLDAFTLNDVQAVVELFGEPEVLDRVFAFDTPYPPYKPEHAVAWIAGHLPDFLAHKGVVFAIRLDGRLLGCVSLDLDRAQDRGRMGYWLGRPFWGQGYATEAVRAVLAYGFQQLALEKVEADHIAGNAASARVMEKAGLMREGLRPHHNKKRGAYLDEVLYGLTRAAAAAAGVLSAYSAALGASPTPPPRPRHPDDPPYAEELVAANATSIERTLLQRHFLGKSVDELEQELRVYGKSLAPDFANLAPVGLGYYLKSAQKYLDSEFSEGDWDFAHGLVAAIAPRLRDSALPKETHELAQALVRHVRDQAARYFIEADKQPFAGWVAEALAD